jgi:hypothetical protein
VVKAGAAATRVTLDYSAAVESAVVNIKAFTGSQVAVAQAQEIANRQLALGRSGYQDTLTALADLTPLARRYGASLQDLLTTTQLLAALDPAQGFQGAAIAIREALSGDFISLARRFEIPRTEIARLKAEGLPNLEIVRRALADLGITEDVLTARAQTFTQRQTIALDTLRKFVADAGKPIFDVASDSLAGFIKLLNDPAIKQGGIAFGNEFAKNVNDVRHTLQELAGNTDVRGIAAGLGKGAAAAGELFDSLEGVRRVVTLGGFERLLIVVKDFSLGVGVIGDSVSILVRDASAFGKQVDDLIEKVGALRRLRDAAGLGPGPTATTGSVARPATVAVPPPTEAQFDITAQKNEGARQAQLFEQGVADLRAYLDGFSSQDFDLFGKLKPQIEASFRRAFADLDADQLAGGLQDRRADRPDHQGHRHDRPRQRADPGGHPGRLRRRGGRGARARRRLRARGAGGQRLYRRHGPAAAVAQGQLAAVTATANAQSPLPRMQLTAAQRAASANQAQFQNQVAALQQALSAIEREAQQVARAYDDTLRGLQSALAASQRAGEEAQRQFAAQVAAIQRAGAEAQKQFQQQIEAAQKEQEAIQRAAQQHSEAFAAVLDNTTDEFLANKAAENEALDEQTKRILELGQAYQEYARQATAADHAVRQAGRAGGPDPARLRPPYPGGAQCRATRRRRAPSNASGIGCSPASARIRQVTRDEAVVAGQKAQDARDPLEQERRRVAEQDKINGDAADKRVKEIQDQAKARAEADQAAIDAIQEQAKQRAEADRLAQQAIQDRIDQTQEEARAAAQMYADRKQGVQDEIDKVNERARQQKIADDAAILAAQQTLDLVKSIEDKRIDAARQGARNAQDAANAAKAEYDAQLLALDAMNKRNSALDTYIQKWKDFIDYLKAEYPGAAVLRRAEPAAAEPQAGGGVTEGGGTGAPEAPPPAPAGPGFFGMVMAPTGGTDFQRAALPTYTAPAAPTSSYRAPVPPALNVSSYTAGLASASARARRRRVWGDRSR